MNIPFTQVDAFASEPFTGNPAAVVVLSNSWDDAPLQHIAMEMNLSETAFLVQTGPNAYNLRWFTPTREVALCGHATLASAHALLQQGQVDASQPILFATQSGLLRALPLDGGIQLDFPAEPPTVVEDNTLKQTLEDAMGTHVLWLGQNRMDYLLELSSDDAVRGLSPNMTALAAVPARGIIVTAPSTHADWDVVSRGFFPQVGVPEDPVTGSAHCAIGPYWAKKWNRKSLRGYQASARGGTVVMTMQDNRVLLWGKAVTTITGEICY